MGEEAQRKFPAHLQDAFLLVFSQTGRESHSAEAVGLDPRTPQYWARHNWEFSCAYHQAELNYADLVKAEVRRRAIDGVPTPVFHNGVQVGTVLKFSDKLLELEAQRIDPAYRPRPIYSKTVNNTNTQINGDLVNNKVDYSNLSREELEQYDMLLGKLLDGPQEPAHDPGPGEPAGGAAAGEEGPG